ncbi:MAG: hypothetical protein WKG07_05730 [Hymenobacter sp.]
MRRLLRRTTPTTPKDFLADEPVDDRRRAAASSATSRWAWCWP